MKQNDIKFIDRAIPVLKFITLLIGICIIVIPIIFYPIKSKIEGVEESVTRLERESDQNFSEVKEDLKSKADIKMMNIHMGNISESISQTRDDVKGLKSDFKEFQRQMVQMIMQIGDDSP